MLTVQPLCEQLHRKIWPKTVVDPGWRGQRHWFFLQGVMLVFSFLVANAVPFFADFQNIIGAGLGAPIAFAWPAVFYLLGMRKAGRRVPLIDKLCCGFFLVVLLPICTGCGVTAAVQALIQDWKTLGKPFDCHLAGYS